MLSKKQLRNEKKNKIKTDKIIPDMIDNSWYYDWKQLNDKSNKHRYSFDDVYKHYELIDVCYRMVNLTSSMLNNRTCKCFKCETFGCGFIRKKTNKNNKNNNNNNNNESLLLSSLSIKYVRMDLNLQSILINEIDNKKSQFEKVKKICYSTYFRTYVIYIDNCPMMTNEFDIYIPQFKTNRVEYYDSEEARAMKMQIINIIQSKYSFIKFEYKTPWNIGLSFNIHQTNLLNENEISNFHFHLINLNTKLPDDILRYIQQFAPLSYFDLCHDLYTMVHEITNNAFFEDKLRTLLPYPPDCLCPKIGVSEWINGWL